MKALPAPLLAMTANQKPSLIVEFAHCRCYYHLQLHLKLVWLLRALRPLVASGVRELVAVRCSEVVKDGRAAGTFRKM